MMCVPRPSLRAVSIAIAVSSPVIILMRTPLCFENEPQNTERILHPPVVSHDNVMVNLHGHQNQQRGCHGHEFVMTCRRGSWTPCTSKATASSNSTTSSDSRVFWLM